MVKNPPANAGDIRDSGSIAGLGRSPGGGHDSPGGWDGEEGRRGFRMGGHMYICG